MKTKLFIKDVAIAIGVVVGFITVVVLLTIYYLLKAAATWWAILTSRRNKRRLLRQLKKINEPAGLVCRLYEEGCDSCGGCQPCAANICPFVLADRCEQLIGQCRQAGIKDWRIRLVGLPNY